jgi:sarcosine oxidase
MRVLRQTLHWFATDRPEHFAPERCPTFIWLHGATIEDSFYGFPMADGVNGVKVATEQMREACDPDAVDRAVTSALIEAMHREHLAGRLPSVHPRSVDTATCLYTMAGDGQFVVDRHPVIEHVTVVSACSGHGFKHSAALGEAVAAQALGLAPTQDLRPFATLAAPPG